MSDPNTPDKKDDDLDKTIEVKPTASHAPDATIEVGAPQAAAASSPTPAPPSAAPKPPGVPKPPGMPKPPGAPKPPGPPKPPGAPKPPSPPPAPTPPVEPTPSAPPVEVPATPTPQEVPPTPKPAPPRPPGVPKPPSPPKPPGAPKPPAPPKPPGDPPPPAGDPPTPSPTMADAAAAPSPPKPPAPPKPPGAPKPPGVPAPPKAPGVPKPPSAAPTPPSDGPKPPAPPSGPKAPSPPGAPAAPKPPGVPVVPKPPGAAAPPKTPGPPPAPGAAKPAAAAAPAPPPEPIDPNSPEALIAQVPIFKEVSPALRKTLVEEGQFRVLAPKTVVCKEGEYTADFFVVLQGLVDVYKQTADGSKYLATLPANSWFGEMSCMSNAPRSATVMATTDAVVLSVPRHAFMKVYGDKKSAGFKRMVDEVYKDRSIALHLSSVSLFRGIKESVLKKIGDVAELVVAEKGETIVKEGDPGDAFFLVRTGHAKVTRGEEILAWLCENSFFGEVALIEDTPRRSTVAAVDRMDLVKIPKAPFLSLLDKFPEVKTTILDRARRIYEEEFLTDEEAAARVRAREIGTEHEVVKAGEALVIDMSKCTRCNMCVEGCVEAHEDRIPRIGKRGIQYGDLLLTSSCYNCRVPDCMLACKFGAIRRDRRGQVNIDPEACTGCALCEPACPYGTIHMQSLVGDESLEVVASPISTFLSKIPGFSSLAKPKAIAKKDKEDETAETGGKKRLRMAVKCDLCAGRADMACIYNCPCGAIERIDPSILLG